MFKGLVVAVSAADKLAIMASLAIPERALLRRKWQVFVVAEGHKAPEGAVVMHTYVPKDDEVPLKFRGSCLHTPRYEIPQKALPDWGDKCAAVILLRPEAPQELLPDALRNALRVCWPWVASCRRLRKD